MTRKIPHMLLSALLGFFTIILINWAVLKDSKPGPDTYQRIVAPVGLKKRLFAREARRRHKKAFRTHDAA